MKIITYISQYEYLNPKVQRAFKAGCTLGLIIGGFVAIIYSAIIYILV